MVTKLIYVQLTWPRNSPDLAGLPPTIRKSPVTPFGIKLGKLLGNALAMQHTETIPMNIEQFYSQTQKVIRILWFFSSDWNLRHMQNFSDNVTNVQSKNFGFDWRKYSFQTLFSEQFS